MLESKKRGRPDGRPPLKEFEKKYNKMSIGELAEHYGVSRVTIYRWAKSFREDEKNA